MNDHAQGRLTYDEYAALPDDGRRYQLLDGELIEMTAPNAWHQLILVRLATLLDLHVRPAKLGTVLFAPFDVVIDEHNVVQPDVLFVSNERRSILRKANLRGAPDLCVEVLSPSTHGIDRLRKLALYARAGVPHYWIIAPETQVIEEYLLDGDAYRPLGVTGLFEPFRPSLFEGFVFHFDRDELPED